MAAREYMVEFRKKHRISLEDMAKICRISPQLLFMLEENDQEVTHPNIAKRVGKKYQLTKAQIKGMLPSERGKGHA